MLSTLNITNVFIGASAVTEIYQGDVLVWPMSSETYTLYTCIYGDNRGDGSNNNYIELPFHTGGNLKVRFQGEVLYTTGGNILGGVYSADTYDYRFFYTGRNVFLDMGSRRQQKVFAMTGLTDFTISNFKLYDNVTGLNILTGATVANVPTENTFKVNISKLKLTAISAWTDDTLIFAGVPAQRDSDGALGILDTLTNNFYTPLYPEHIYGCEPPVTGNTLTHIDSINGLNIGDNIVLAGYTNVTISGRAYTTQKIVAYSANTNNYFYNAEFDGFDGSDGNYILPSNASVFTVAAISNNQVEIKYNGNTITAKQETDAIGNQNYVLINGTNYSPIRIVQNNNNLMVQCNSLVGYPLVYDGRYNNEKSVFYNGVPSDPTMACTYRVYKI